MKLNFLRQSITHYNIVKKATATVHDHAQTMWKLKLFYIAFSFNTLYHRIFKYFSCLFSVTLYTKSYLEKFLNELLHYLSLFVLIILLESGTIIIMYLKSYFRVVFGYFIMYWTNNKYTNTSKNWCSIFIHIKKLLYILIFELILFYKNTSFLLVKKYDFYP